MTPFRTRGNTWDNAKLDMLEIFPGDIPVPLSTVVPTFNPFAWFEEAQNRPLMTDTSSVMSVVLFNVHVVGFNAALTQFYESCGNCAAFFKFKPGEVEACPFCVKYAFL